MPQGGKAERNLDTGKARVIRKEKKEEFPGTMRNMPAGNSFPQICVVSENYSLEIISR